MLRSVNHIIGYKIEASDGDFGKVSDFYFEDEHWVIRYLVADTGSLITGKLVLISPASFEGPQNWEGKKFRLCLTKKMIKNSPEITEDLPVSRQKERELAVYYNWPQYWQTWPWTGYPTTLPEQYGTLDQPAPLEEKQLEQNSHLRSARELFKYRIHAKDGEIGHVEDLIVDDGTWTLHYAVIDTRNWLPGKRVLISTDIIKGIDWASTEVEVSATREQIHAGPEFNPDMHIENYEDKLYTHHAKRRN